MSVTVDIQRSGFPVKIGTVERWFETSAESLMRFENMEEEALKRLNEFQKQVIDSNLDKDLEAETITMDTLKGAIELEKKFLEIQYDLLLGDGTFAELYELYPDYQALENTLEAVATLISNKLEELAEERKKEAKKRAAKYTAKTKTAAQKKK